MAKTALNVRKPIQYASTMSSNGINSPYAVAGPGPAMRPPTANPLTGNDPTVAAKKKRRTALSREEAPVNPLITPGMPNPVEGMESRTLSRGVNVPWYKLPETDEYFISNMRALAKLQRTDMRRTARVEAREEAAAAAAPTTTALGSTNTSTSPSPTETTTTTTGKKPAKTASATSTMTEDTGSTGGENTKKGERGSSALAQKLEPRHRRLLSRIRRMSRRSMPPAPPAPLSPYQYTGSTQYQPSAAMVSTTRNQGLQGTMLR